MATRLNALDRFREEVFKTKNKYGIKNEIPKPKTPDDEEQERLQSLLEKNRTDRLNYHFSPDKKLSK